MFLVLVVMLYFYSFCLFGKTPNSWSGQVTAMVEYLQMQMDAGTLIRADLDPLLIVEASSDNRRFTSYYTPLFYILLN